MGIHQRHIAREEDSVTAMATIAAQHALEDAGIPASDIDLVISHGSEHKDHLVWNAAAKIQANLAASNAFAFEVYALCAGAPIALEVARGMMMANPALRHVLLVAASREGDLVDLQNTRARFMFNFGAGAGACVLRRGQSTNVLLGSAAFTDGTLSETVILTEGDQREEPARHGDLVGMLDVTDPTYMAERLGATSLDRFTQVIREAAIRGGADPGDIAFLGITHMKRSFYLEILDAIGLTPEQSVYLDSYGHVQSVDQYLALQLGLSQGRIRDGDLVILAGAGTGYTWSATALRWGQN
jgi:3-oxoacyl-[acyl-carrier-protein] synthase III